MQRTNIRLAGVLVALLLVILTTAAVLAQDKPQDKGSAYERWTARVAELLGKQPGEVRSAMTRAHEELVDEAVEEGKVSPERAEKLKRRSHVGGFPVAHPHGQSRVGRVAKVEGQTLTLQTPRGELTVRLQDDTKVRKPGTKPEKTTIEVGNVVRVIGKRQEGDALVARRVHILPARHLLKHSLLGEYERIAEFLKIAPEELRSELRNGKSLAQLAGSERTPELIKLLIAAAEKHVDEAVADAEISPERAQQIKDKLPERVARIVNKQRNSEDDD
ncbi:MAG: hypothetical protein M3P51_18255 [Chloroflexota bacterium]|nr:hypothetical protein [Chloroflexota bacterium]